MWLPVGPYVPRPQSIPLGVTSVPHPDYPGYGYDPLNPTQLYELPQTTSLSNPASSTTAPTGAASGPPSGDAAPGSAAVVIANVGQSGTVMDYQVDGVSHRIVAGRQERLEIGPKSTIVYNRGGSLGPQRYALSQG
jgi:hypothetical protein